MDKQSLLKGSVDVKKYRNSIIEWSLAAVFCILMMFLFRENVGIIIVSVIFIFVAAYFLCIYGFGLYEILKEPNRYEYFYGTPTAAHTSDMPSKRPPVYFVLSFNDGFEDIEVETNAVFSYSLMSKFYFGDMFDKKFLVLYDRGDGSGERAKRLVVAKVINGDTAVL